ncbi:hypothetical protein [Neisseria gonorrhoeae]|uniref:hypothetical protein n=1 Tax=Neisseria gonorrhoeae TaxID=485 RepID=UPI0013DEF2D2|nr:hypothetical protein [Neisseria gonorrhoeae]
MQQNQSPHYTFREGRLKFPFRTIRQAAAARACTVSDMADLGRNAEPPAIAANNTTYIRHFLQM